MGKIESLFSTNLTPLIRSCLECALKLTPSPLPDEGLKKDGTSLSQIPTFVTGVPDGTEKVKTLPFQTIARTLAVGMLMRTNF